MPDSPTEKELQQDFVRIEQKRDVLEQLVHITKAIEEMQDSLNAVLVLGATSQDFPKEALELYKSLSGNFQNLPTSKIREYLEKLDLVVKDQFGHIMQLAGFDFVSTDSVEAICLEGESSSKLSAMDLLTDFKRTAQTAVSLRILLKKRGVATPGSALPVPRQVMDQQLKQLDKQEGEQRKKVKHKIVDMKEDIGVMLKNPAYPESMKKMLLGVQENLDKDITTIESGGKLDRLSFIADTQEITDIQHEQPESGPAERQEVAQQDPGKRGFTDKAGEWLTTPWSVSWKDLE